MTRRLAAFLGTPVVTLLALLGIAVTAAPAFAVTTEEKIAVMSRFTQTSADSYAAWNSARLNQPAWAGYGFDWSTDYCSSSPDEPLGFDFRLSCARHDWGYRNYKLMNLFSPNRPRLDDAFYADLRRKCATYSVWVRPACNSLAWTYYQAVVAFGGVSITKADLDRAARLKAEGEARAALAPGNAR
jgi:Prokaryotic phospholipase A2